MAKQTFTSGQVLTAAEMNSLQENDYNWTVTTKTASYTLAAGDEGTRVVMNNAGATTITVDDAVFAAGDVVWVHNIGAGTCTITAGTATVNTAGSLELAQWGGGAIYFTSASTAIFFPAGGASPVVEVEFLVVGGGGGGSSADGPGSGAGAGGAGGLRASYSTDSSGGGGSSETAITLLLGTAYPITVGAGGAGTPTPVTNSIGSQGFPSQFGPIVSIGGGAGGHSGTPGTPSGAAGGAGGGAAGYGPRTAGSGSTNQGYAGGNSANRAAGGGGGAGVAGSASPGQHSPGPGGNGVISTIIPAPQATTLSVGEVSGSDVYFGGGGGGGTYTFGNATGGTGGGGPNGATRGPASNSAGVAGTANTGGGGGGGTGHNYAPDSGGGAGGSGVIIFRLPDTYTVTFSGGVTANQDTSSVSGTNIVTVTATSTLYETVTIS